MTRAEEQAEQLKEWLREHLPYELSMMRYSFRKMAVPGDDQFAYNAHYECFAIKARLLLDFIGCRDNLKATHFVQNFNPPPREHLKKTFQQLDIQVLHNIRSRLGDRAKKISFEDCERFALWFERGMDTFRAALSQEQRELWGTKVDPRDDWKVVAGLRTRPGATASSGGIVMTTATAGAVSVTLKNVPEPKSPAAHVVISYGPTPGKGKA